MSDPSLARFRRDAFLQVGLGILFVCTMTAGMFFLGRAVLFQPRKALVVLRTPTEAVVMVDGEVRHGNARVIPGSHTVKVVIPGRPPVSTDVNLEAGTSVAVTMDADGTIRTTTP